MNRLRIKAGDLIRVGASPVMLIEKILVNYFVAILRTQYGDSNMSIVDKVDNVDVISEAEDK